MRRKKGASIGELLTDIGSRLDRKSHGALSQSRLVTAWEKVAGQRVLEHTGDLRFRDGELVIFVDSPAWATELSALSERYKEAIAVELGEELVRSVRFSVSSKVSRDKAARREEEEKELLYQPDPHEPIPLTDAERAQVEASASVISDPGLREAAIRATVADLQWKKGIAAAKRRQQPREGV